MLSSMLFPKFVKYSAKEGEKPINAASNNMYWILLVLNLFTLVKKFPFSYCESFFVNKRHGLGLTLCICDVQSQELFMS